jgi:thiaminase/transcriptional activator TenA
VSRAVALRGAAAEIWEASLTHPFVAGIGDGSLDERAFQWYIRQDYRYLVDYGRLLSLGAAQAPRLTWMRRFAALSLAVLETEMELHRSFAARWGVDDLDETAVAPATAAYCDFLLRTAALGDFGELVAAVVPCMWGYAEIGTALAGSATSDRYREWIEMYASDEFGELADWSRELLDAVDGDDARMEAAFVASSRHELAFWEAAWLSRDAA